MRIGIIGAGQIGGTLARRFTAIGHEVFIANSRGPASLAALAKETGATPVTVEQAARSGDVVVVTIPMKNIPRLPVRLFQGVPDNVVVIDTGNYYPQQRDGRIDPIERGTTESRWVSEQLGRPVVKAFNNIYARHLLEYGKPKGADRRAKDIVSRLLDELGFDGVDAGSLDESWRQQPATPVYGTDLDVEGVRKALAAAKLDRSPDFQAESGSPAGTR
jgi:predicted dinucleotide-binding enzyme